MYRAAARTARHLLDEHPGASSLEALQPGCTVRVGVAVALAHAKLASWVGAEGNMSMAAVT